MALEAVIYQQDPFSYGGKDYNYTAAVGGYAFGLQQAIQEDNPPTDENLVDIKGEQCSNGYWDSPPPSSVAQNTTSSPETCAGAAPGDGFFPGSGVCSPPVAAGRRKRRRTRSLKNKEEMENQRMTHIAVERNRRRQMNDYLAVLRSLMPPSYAQRGDQASIVGGAINFVKELEQLLQFLETHKSIDQQHQDVPSSDVFSNFFTFPQYSTRPSGNSSATAADDAAERWSGIADIEATMVESHANIKVMAKRRPKQLLKMVAGLQSIGLTILHLNVTTVDQSVLYSFSVKVEEDCQFTSVNEISTAVHNLVGVIQEESTSIRDNHPHDTSERAEEGFILSN
ncbi:Transcription factor [Sesamum angolense]|uniref:Transcription factor n=1 Tax=Sesamum angolense TaxID=2727404 RepID=A0AAE1XHQ8_9LAMI|nr:Transcription factor [Sesamum angolense]